MADFNTVVFVGPGLLGGSIARACRAVFPGIKCIAAVRSPEKFSKLKTDGVFDDIVSSENIPAKDSDLFVVSTPVVSSVSLIRGFLLRDDLKSEALIVDVGSIKSEILKGLEGIPALWRFVACHPMAGSEKTGFEHSRVDLLEKATVVLTPHKENRNKDLLKISSFWEALGAEVFSVDPQKHDHIVAYTSHLPHLLSSVLVKTILSSGFSAEDIGYLSGGGLHDMSRLADGSPVIWRDIILMNRQYILETLHAYGEELMALVEIIQKATDPGAEIQAFLEKTQKVKRKLL